MQRRLCRCGSENFEEGGFGLDFCLRCGTGKPGGLTNHMFNHFFRADRILPKQCYTRVKRFKKYLFRAMRQQASSSVPQETWQYLLDHGPYRDARHVQLTLKQARHLARKCYDSLPYLTAALCPHIKVPTLTEREKERALQMFDRIDRSIRSGPFISYLYCLEYILRRMKRQDVCAHINQIQCPKRRATYKLRLDHIFGASETVSIENIMRNSGLRRVAVDAVETLKLEVPGDPAFAPDLSARLQEALLSRHVAGRGDVARARRHGQVRLDENLVVE